MMSEQFKYLEQKPKTSVWKYVGWTAYIVLALLSTAFVAMVSGSPWFILAWIVAAIFGPKLWRNIG